MEQVIAFALGMFIVTLVVGFVNMFRASKTVKANKSSIDGLRSDMQEMREWIVRMNDDVYRGINNGEIHMQSEIDDLRKLIDSKTDKLDIRIQHRIDNLEAGLDVCRNTTKKNK